MGTDLNSVVKQEGSKNKARRTSLSPAKSLPRRAGWTSQSAMRRDDQLNKEGKVVSVVPGRKSRTGSPGRQRKQLTSTTAIAKYLRPGMAASFAQKY